MAIGETSALESATQPPFGAHPIRDRFLAASMIAACGVGGAAYGAFTDTDVRIGPHTATAKATLDGGVNTDFGWFGSIDTPISFAGGFGGKITLGQIPESTDASVNTSAGVVIEQYQQLFSDPAQAVNGVTETVAQRVVNDGIGGLGWAAGGMIGLSFAWSRARDPKKQALQTLFCRNEGSRSSYRYGRMAVAFGLVATACSSSPNTEIQQPAVDHVFDGTPLQGSRVHGELLRLIVDQAAPWVIGQIQTVQSFYKTAAANVQSAYTYGAAPYINHDDTLYALSISDNHCNLGMSMVSGAVAKSFGVDVIIDSGDSTMSGTPAEQQCISAEASQFPETPIVWVKGNHDSATTVMQAQQHGMHVVKNDQTITVGGLTFLGEGDPRSSTFGTPIHLNGTETIADEANNLQKAACAAKERPDVLLVHNPDAAMPTMLQSCAGISISGDTHVLSKPALVSFGSDGQPSYQFTEGTTGGAAIGKPTVGVLRADSVQTVLAFSKKTHQLTGSYFVITKPDKTVSITFGPAPNSLTTDVYASLPTD